MKKTKISANGNLMWEGSRMILPEHRSALLQTKNEATRKQRPVFDEQELEELNYRLQVALYTQTEITITIFGEFKDTIIIGRIKNINHLNKRLDVIVEGRNESIEINDVIKLYFPK